MWIFIDGITPRSPRKTEPIEKPFFARHCESNKLLNRLRYRGGIYVTRLIEFGNPEEILDWINENLKKELTITHIGIHHYLRFRTKEAFIAYKLRWR